MKLLVIIWILSIKSDYNAPHGYFDEMMILLKEINPKGNLLSPKFYETKNLVSKLGFG